MSRRPRHPNPDELRLWRQVAGTVTPIGRDTATPIETTPAAGRTEKVKAKAATAAPRVGSTPPAGAKPAGTGIDQRLRGKAVRGRVAIDARVDLHGMTQAAAHRRLAAFLHQAQAGGARLVLVITGKGRTAAPGEARGVLRRAVPQWLGSAEFRPFVVGFGEAGRRHGGEGALYVHIRRPHGRG